MNDIVTELPSSESNIALLNEGEINQQIATAKRFPRSITAFMHEASALVTLNEDVARQCIYALPRGGKVIEGPSARFAEIIAHCWGNSRAGARIVNEGREFITAQGVMMDLEKNVAITFEIQRRITDKNGIRYNADMIGVTGNAASSIALRNCILKVVPKAFWDQLYRRARAVVAGNVETLSNKRASAIERFAIFGITPELLCMKLGRAGVADITVDDLVTLFGLLTAIQEGDTTPEDAFAFDASARAAMPQSKAAKPPMPAATDEQQTQETTAAATPAPAPAPASDDGEVISKGERAHLVAQVKKSGLTREQIMEASTIDPEAETITKAGFSMLIAAIKKAAK